MPWSRLNLEALRRRPPARSPDSSPTLTRLVASDGAITVSRRELLGMAGLAAVTLPPLTRSLTPGLLGRVEIVRQPGRVAVKLGGRERWVIDPARFSGTPRVEVSGEDQTTILALRGARYPGTGVPADFEARLTRGLTGWRMRVRLALTGAVSEAGLESWLVGAEVARCRARLNLTACDLGCAGKLSLGGLAQVDFFPDGSLYLDGTNLVSFRHGRDTLSASGLSVSLPPEQDASLLAQPPARRTLLSFSRDGRPWALNRALSYDQSGRLTAEGEVFDRVEIEIGETAGGRTVSAFVARGNDSSRLAYSPAPGVETPAGEEFMLGLCNPRYAVSAGSRGEERAFLADFSPEFPALRCNGTNVVFDGAASELPFELVARGERVQHLRCEPVLHSLTAPMPGAITDTVYPESPLRVAFTTGGAEASGEDGERLAQVQPAPRPVPRPVPRPTPTPAPAPTPAPTQPGGEVILRPEGPILNLPLLGLVVPVIRSEDLLALTFRFVNLTYKAPAGGQPARLERTEAGKPCYLVVEFPPQHIAEQALFEADPNFQIKPPDPDAGNTGSEMQSPPLGARLAGPSRLAFRIPEKSGKIEPITYGLASLLDWSKYELSVAPTALPPPLQANWQIRREGAGMRVIPGGAAPRQLPSAGGVRLPRTGTSASPEESLQVQFLAAGTPTGQPAARSGGTLNLATQDPGLLVEPRLVDPGIFRVILKPSEPTREQTAIEAPYRLILSPSELAAWVHSFGVVTHNGRTELWHTRLGVKGSDGTLYDRKYRYALKDDAYQVTALLPDDLYKRLRTVRAIWSPDFSETVPVHDSKAIGFRPFRMSLDAHDRCELVALTADYTLGDSRTQYRTVEANRVMLSGLGAWLDVHYAADVPTKGRQMTIEEWVHQATMGRDQYVKVVYKGYLFPFGHRASLVKVTERKFLAVGNQNIAYLFQRMFIIVREPEKEFPAAYQDNEGRACPFRKVQLSTLITPNLNQPVGLLAGMSAQAAFWPMVMGTGGAQDFQWHLIGEDWDGQRLEFTMPLIFVGVDPLPNNPKVGVAFDRASMTTLTTLYNGTTAARRQADLKGQNLAFAESLNPGDTNLETESLTFGAEVSSQTNVSAQSFREANQADFYPTIALARVRIPAAAVIAGQGGSVDIKLHERYVKGGWDAGQNPAETFAKLAGEALPLVFSADKAGGLATPNLGISGLSRAFGPVGDVANLAAGTFDPKKYLSLGAKILGTVDLADIIVGLFGIDQIPKLVTNHEKDPTTGLPRAITTKYDWRPKLQSWGIGTGDIFHVDGTSSLQILCEARMDLTGGASTARVYGALKNVYLYLVPIPGVAPEGFVQLKINELSFTANPADGVKVVCDLRKPIKFAGPLSFVNKLAEVIDAAGFVDPPYLDVDTSGIKLGYSLALPAISVGMFSLSNISFSADLKLPFIGGAFTMYFAFAERQNPFLVQVSVFGGGGFFGIELGIDKVRMIEASFEFGGTFSLDIGVASGNAHVMAGIYFKLENKEVSGKEINAITLEGYLRCGGSLNVLGLIHISVEFYMGLIYQSETGSVKGRASLEVEIGIAFFSISVTLTVEREFAGSSSSAWLEDGAQLAAANVTPGLVPAPSYRLIKTVNPPTFEETMTPDDWAAYAAAFA